MSDNNGGNNVVVDSEQTLTRENMLDQVRLELQKEVVREFFLKVKWGVAGMLLGGAVVYLSQNNNDDCEEEDEEDQI